LLAIDEFKGPVPLYQKLNQFIGVDVPAQTTMLSLPLVLKASAKQNSDPGQGFEPGPSAKTETE